jgi:hypothetical protein
LAFTVPLPAKLHAWASRLFASYHSLIAKESWVAIKNILKKGQKCDAGKRAYRGHIEPLDRMLRFDRYRKSDYNFLLDHREEHTPRQEACL